MGSLPGLDASDSLLSFNTTATDSNPSQVPAPTFDVPTSSVHNLPQWHVPMTKLSSLHHLLNSSTGKGNRVNLIVCVVSVDRVKVVQRKEEKVRGREGTVCIGRFEVVVPGDDRDKEIGCDVKLWEGCARDWGEEVVRRGDVVLLESMCHIPYLH
jgi:hypothetical protein